MIKFVYKLLNNNDIIHDGDEYSFPPHKYWYVEYYLNGEKLGEVDVRIKRFIDRHKIRYRRKIPYKLGMRIRHDCIQKTIS